MTEKKGENIILNDIILSSSNNIYIKIADKIKTIIYEDDKFKCEEIKLEREPEKRIYEKTSRKIYKKKDKRNLDKSRLTTKYNIQILYYQEINISPIYDIKIIKNNEIILMNKITEMFDENQMTYDDNINSYILIIEINADDKIETITMEYDEDERYIIYDNKKKE